MKESIQIMLVTTAVFLGGLLTGVWTQRLHPPPPPFFEQGDLSKEFGQAEPAIRAYREKLDSIRRESRTKIAALLDPSVRARYERMEEAADALKEDGPPHAPHALRKVLAIAGPLAGPLENDDSYLSFFIYRPYLERLAEELPLTPAQKEKSREILETRRREALALADRETPPALVLFPKLRPPPRE